MISSPAAIANVIVTLIPTVLFPTALPSIAAAGAVFVIGEVNVEPALVHVPATNEVTVVPV